MNHALDYSNDMVYMKWWNNWDNSGFFRAKYPRCKGGGSRESGVRKHTQTHLKISVKINGEIREMWSSVFARAVDILYMLQLCEINSYYFYPISCSSLQLIFVN